MVHRALPALEVPRTPTAEGKKRRGLPNNTNYQTVVNQDGMRVLDNTLLLGTGVLMELLLICVQHRGECSGLSAKSAEQVVVAT